MPLFVQSNKDRSKHVLPSPIRILSATLSANGTITIPAGYMILGISIRETANHAVTGGIKIGTASGGTQVVTAQAVGALSIVGMADVNISLKYFSSSIDTILYIQAVVAWNSAIINISIPTIKVE